MLADRPHANGVSALCSVPLPSGDTVPIVSGGWDHAVKLWQLPVEDGGAAAPRIESLPKLHKSVVQALAWSGGEDALLSGGADGRVRSTIWSALYGSCSRPIDIRLGHQYDESQDVDQMEGAVSRQPAASLVRCEASLSRLPLNSCIARVKNTLRWLP